MNNETFKKHHLAIVRIAEIVTHLQLEEYIEELERADLGGCVTNPDLHADAMDGLARMKQEAESLLYVQKVRLNNREHQSDQVNTDNAAAALAWLHNLMQ